MTQTISTIKGEFPAWCREMLQRNNFVVLDTETTDPGPRWDKGQAVELAIIDHNGQTLYDKLIKPTCAIGKAAEIHHITEAQLEDAPTWAEEWLSINELLQGKIILTYNARFDAGIIERSCEAHNIELPRYSWYCLMDGYANFWKERSYYGYKWQSLEKAMKQQNLPVVSAHRALNDTLMAYTLMIHCGSDNQLMTDTGPYTSRI